MSAPLVYKALLHLYPTEFRNRFGPEMLAVFLDARAESKTPYPAFLSRELTSLIAGSFKQRACETRGHAFLTGGLAAFSIHLTLYKLLLKIPAWKTIFFLALLTANLQAQTATAEASIRDLYQQVLSAIRQAKTEQDIRRVVEIMDVREWLSIDPTGLPMVRQQAHTDLQSLLALPPDRRTPQMEILWFGSTAATATVVLWVYSPREITDKKGRYGAPGETRKALIGSLARDTFARTENGWRRVRHEKIFPNQVLAVDGRSLIAPPLPPASAIPNAP